MPKLTKQQLDVLLLAKKGGNDASLLLLKMIHEIWGEIENLKEEYKKEKADEVERLAMKLATKLVDIAKGDDGHTPTKGELLALIKPIIEKEASDIQSYNNSAKNDIENRIKKLAQDIESQLAKDMNFVRDKVRSLKDGHTPTREEINAIVEPVVIEKVGKKAFNINNIEGLDEFVRERLPKASGGGVTNLRIIQAFKYILKTEQPTGDIDGVNTEYTVTQPIFAILAFSLNGEVIAQLPNYTIAGKTITFSTALPAAYSGKDFEVKYI